MMSSNVGVDCPQPLARDKLLSACMAHTDAAATVEVVAAVDSTNDYLLRKAAQPADHFVICSAESQRCGRGRGGHQWLSPANGNVYLSVLTPYAAKRTTWLSLMSAVAVAQQLKRLGVPAIGVKWPNDILYDGRLKLAGLLIESRRQRCVIGLGLNIHVPSAEPPNSAAPHCTALDEIVARRYDRNILAGQLSAALINAFHQANDASVAQLMASWQTYDVLTGCSLTVRDASGDFFHGVVVGVDADARLLLRQRNGQQRAFTTAHSLSIHRHKNA